MHFLKGNYLERPQEAGNPYPGCIFMKGNSWKGPEKREILIPVDFTKSTDLERHREAGDPYPSAFDEGNPNP